MGDELTAIHIADTIQFFIPERMHFAAQYQLQSTYTSIIYLHYLSQYIKQPAVDIRYSRRLPENSDSLP